MPVYKRPKEDQNFWNFLFSCLYAVLLFLAVGELHELLGYWPNYISLFDALLIVLAIFRITRLLVYDKITRFARDWFLLRKETTDAEGNLWVVLEERPVGMFRTMHELLQCPWCVGVWVGLVVVFSYFAFEWAWIVILILALAGLGSLVQILANFIGWRAELGKLEAHGHAAKGNNVDIC